MPHDVGRILFLVLFWGVLWLGLIAFIDRNPGPRWAGILSRPLWQRFLLLGVAVPLIVSTANVVITLASDWVESIAIFAGSAIGGMVWVLWHEMRSGITHKSQ